MHPVLQKTLNSIFKMYTFRSECLPVRTWILSDQFFYNVKIRHLCGDVVSIVSTAGRA